MLTATSGAPVAEQAHRRQPLHLVARREPEVRRVPLTRLRFRRRRTMDPSRLYYGPPWLAASAAGAALGLLGLRRFGLPFLAGAGALGALTWGHAAYGEPSRPVLERVELRLSRLPAALDGLRIGQISDTHLGFRYAERNLAWGVEQMRREAPDLLALTGDFISFRHAIPEIAALFRGVSAPLGVYAVPGNHDYWEGVEDVSAALAVCGVTMLMNQHRRLRWNGGELWLLGADDIWDGRASLPAALRGVPPGAFTLLLAHSPDYVEEAAAHSVDVQLSGHTHGGHIRLPLLGPLGMPRFGRRFIMGRYQVGPTTLYVSRGLAGPPLRLLCPPEATIITLRRG
jgi:uncharacterized protein